MVAPTPITQLPLVIKLSKVDTLAEVLGLHPLTLLTLAYLEDRRMESAEALMARVA
jgi:hypothetical protein